jgi:hypothetical protein
LAFWINVLVAALAISLSSWLSGRSPGLAGFLVALPLASLLVLPMSYFEHGDPEAAVALARSIFVAIPVSLLFFLPFLFAGRLGLSFWQAYGLGVVALPLGFLAHRAIVEGLLRG